MFDEGQSWNLRTNNIGTEKQADKDKEEISEKRLQWQRGGDREGANLLGTEVEKMAMPMIVVNL